MCNQVEHTYDENSFRIKPLMEIYRLLVHKQFYWWQFSVTHNMQEERGERDRDRNSGGGR